MIKHAGLWVLYIVIAISSKGYTVEFESDRPDFSESPVVVPARAVQIESGIDLTKMNSVKEFTFPEAMLRFGLGHRSELRVGFSGWTRLSVDDVANTFINDLDLEIKYQLTKPGAEVPLGVLLVSTLPTGDDEISVGRAEYGVILAGGYDLNEFMGLGMNIGAVAENDEDERELVYSTALAMEVELNDRLAAFVEFYADIPQHETWQPLMDGGLTCMVNPVTQIDFYIGKGLNDYAPDFIIGAGFSFRFDY